MLFVSFNITRWIQLSRVLRRYSGSGEECELFSRQTDQNIVVCLSLLSVPVARGKTRRRDLLSDEICKDAGAERSNDVIALLKDATIANPADTFAEFIRRSAPAIGRLIELR